MFRKNSWAIMLRRREFPREHHHIVKRSETPMPLTAAMWTHGTIVEVQVPDRLHSIERYGWGTTLTGTQTGPSENWVHIPVPTPVILNDARPELLAVFVLFRADHGARITNVHVWDGGRRVAQFDGLNLTGEHSSAIDGVNRWDISPPLTILYGLGLSVGVDMGGDPDTGVGTITFTTAGADFGHPDPSI